jgi:hypothetical protein
MMQLLDNGRAEQLVAMQQVCIGKAGRVLMQRAVGRSFICTDFIERLSRFEAGVCERHGSAPASAACICVDDALGGEGRGAETNRECRVSNMQRGCRRNRIGPFGPPVASMRHNRKGMKPLLGLVLQLQIRGLKFPSRCPLAFSLSLKTSLLHASRLTSMSRFSSPCQEVLPEPLSSIPW